MSDPAARLPEFLERFHRLVARAQNASLGRWENLWSSEKTSVVHLVSDRDVLDKMAYTLANPTAAGLVRSPSGWPGVITARLNERRRVAMPGVFFNPNGVLPDSVMLETTRPAIYPQLGLAELTHHLHDAVRRLVHSARRALIQAGKTFLGVARILRRSSEDSAASPEPRQRHKPRIAAKHATQRVDAMRSLKAFLWEYRSAWLAWRGGRRDQLFPPGTYALRVHAGVTCRPP